MKSLISETWETLKQATIHDKKRFSVKPWSVVKNCIQCRVGFRKGRQLDNLRLIAIFVSRRKVP